ncbi:MAG: YceI family protein [Rhodanobacteraceae bacterium]
MHARRIAIWLAALALFVGAAARADENRYQTINLDSAQSHAAFSVKAFWLFVVHGTFGNVHGTVRIDHFRSQAVVDARINVDAVHMSNHGYEQGVRSEEFFDAEHYPEIHFVSDSFPLVRLDQGGPLPGMLSMHGTSHPVDFLIAPARCARPAFDCPLRAAGHISRSAFGMQAHGATLGDKVDLTLSIEVTEAPS